MSNSSSEPNYVQWFSTAVGAGGLVASLAYYFGWIYLREQYFEYGTTPQIVGYGRSEIVFRSLSVFIPSAVPWVLGVIALGGFYVAVDRACSWLVSTGGPRPANLPVLTFTQLSASLLILSGFAALLLLWKLPLFDRVGQSGDIERWLAAFFVSVLLLRLAMKYRPELLRSPRYRPASSWINVSVALLSVLLVAQMVRSAASDEGRRTACEIELNPEQYGMATIASPRDLGLPDDVGAPSSTTVETSAVATDQSSASAQPPSFRYDNLRLLTKVNETYWMWPADKSPRDGLVGVPEREILSVTIDRSEVIDRDRPFEGQTDFCKCALWSSMCGDLQRD